MPKKKHNGTKVSGAGGSSVSHAGKKFKNRKTMKLIRASEKNK